jgi:hypothetical protein
MLTHCIRLNPTKVMLTSNIHMFCYLEEATERKLYELYAHTLGLLKYYRKSTLCTKKKLC